MSSFKKGDKVRRTGDDWGTVEQGQVYEVERLLNPISMKLVGHSFSFYPRSFELVLEVAKTKASDTQVGGNYYTTLAIQPMEYSMANKLDACQHTVVKYITRFREKNGLQDLLKAKHTIDLLIEREYKDAK